METDAQTPFIFRIAYAVNLHMVNFMIMDPAEPTRTIKQGYYKEADIQVPCFTELTVDEHDGRVKRMYMKGVAMLKIEKPLPHGGTKLILQ